MTQPTIRQEIFYHSLRRGLTFRAVGNILQACRRAQNVSSFCHNIIRKSICFAAIQREKQGGFGAELFICSSLQTKKSPNGNPLGDWPQLIITSLGANRQTCLSGCLRSRERARHFFCQAFLSAKKSGKEKREQLQAQALAAAGTTTSENLSTVSGSHSLTEAVYLAAMTLLRLECS